MQKNNGMTLIEVMLSIAILGIITSIALPSFSHWIVKIRVDNEISKLHRLLALARNNAVNMENPVVICPFENNICTDDWSKKLIVFIDLNGNRVIDITNDPTTNEPVIYSKEHIKNGDILTYPRQSVIYQPTGQSGGSTGTFRYCPLDHSDKNRGIRVSNRGRVYPSSDIDSDGKDEFRDGSEITSC